MLSSNDSVSDGQGQARGQEGRVFCHVLRKNVFDRISIPGRHRRAGFRAAESLRPFASCLKLKEQQSSTIIHVFEKRQCLAAITTESCSGRGLM